MVKLAGSNLEILDGRFTMSMRALFNQGKLTAPESGMRLCTAGWHADMGDWTNPVVCQQVAALLEALGGILMPEGEGLTDVQRAVLIAKWRQAAPNIPISPFSTFPAVQSAAACRAVDMYCQDIYWLDLSMSLAQWQAKVANVKGLVRAADKPYLLLANCWSTALDGVTQVATPEDRMHAMLSLAADAGAYGAVIWGERNDL